MILVTGGAGFIGSHLCERLLSEGYEVICIDNFDDFYSPTLKEQNIAQALKHKKFELVKGDILDKELLHNIFSTHSITQIIHLAALPGARASINSPDRYVEVNVKGTIDLLEVVKHYPIKQFVFGSSSSVYGVNENLPFSEDDPTESQISPYGVAKKMAELYCKTYHSLYHIPITILRFFTIYGERQRPDMAVRKFTESILKDKEIPVYGNDVTERDYTYIDECIDGIMLAIKKIFEFEIFNIGRGNPIKLKDLIAIIGKKTGKRPKIISLPAQPGDVPITYADISKTRKMLGYEPKISIEEGIDKLLQKYSNFSS